MTSDKEVIKKLKKNNEELINERKELLLKIKVQIIIIILLFLLLFVSVWMKL